MRPTRLEANTLFRDSILSFSRMESVGIRVDEKLLDHNIRKVEKKLKKIEHKLKKSEIGKAWRKRYGSRTNFGARQQLATVLFDVLKWEHPGKKTEKGNRKTDVDVLEGFNDPFVQDFIYSERLKKLKSTYLDGTKRECIDGLIHCFFNLHTAWTFRSSSDHLNFQNFPIRQEEFAKLIRECFIPLHDGWWIIETDFKAIEVSVSACYHKDKRFIHDITTPGADMHLDTAVQIYLLNKHKATKENVKGPRDHVKNKFVFPQFYGDWWMSCALALWTAIERYKLKTEDGTPLYDHLKSKGIIRLGDQNPEGGEPDRNTFEYIVKEVEKDFWQKRFKTYSQWKKDFWQKYLERGYFDLKTGFRCEGIFDRKQVCNTPIQGAAFHCLLWVLNRLDRWIRKHKLRSRIGGQIHDSIYSHVHPKEKDDYVAKVQELISVDLPKAWPWLIVPMAGEVEGSQENWYLKKRIA